MKKMIFCLVLGCCSLGLHAQENSDAASKANNALPKASKAVQQAAWLLSITEGVEKAKAENKLVMVSFTGSDWCPPCMMMSKQVFSKQAFLDGVKKDYVIVKLDMPNSDKSLKEATATLMRKYKVKGLPTILLLDAEGKEFKRFAASEHRTVASYLKRLAKEKRRKNML